MSGIVEENDTNKVQLVFLNYSVFRNTGSKETVSSNTNTLPFYYDLSLISIDFI